jgi:integrase
MNGHFGSWPGSAESPPPLLATHIVARDSQTLGMLCREKAVGSWPRPRPTDPPVLTARCIRPQAGHRGRNRRPAPSFATLMRRLSAICKVHELNGYAGFDNPGRHRDLWPLRRSLRCQLARPKQQTGPTTAADIRRMVQACPPQRFIGLRDQAMLLLGYVLLTASELVALDVEDLQLVDQGLVVVVPRPRPDPGGSRFRWSRCPTSSSRRLVRCGRGWPGRKPPGCTPAQRSDRSTPRSSRRLGAHCIDRLLKRAAQRAGLPDWQRYGIHSQRRGAAIELRHQGASDFEIAQAGGWRLDQVRRSPRPQGSRTSGTTRRPAGWASSASCPRIRICLVTVSDPWSRRRAIAQGAHGDGDGGGPRARPR